MTVYEHIVWSVESPLNEDEEIEWAEPLYIDSAEFEQFPLSSIQQRMFLILGVATFFVVLFGIFVLPSILTTFTRISEVANVEVGNTAVIQQQNEAATVIASGEISPIFSPSVQYWAPQIVEWAAAYQLDPNMVATVMQIESCGDPQAISGAGAQGLFQVMPYHFANGENSLDPDTNAKRGMAYLSERLVQTNGDTGKAFAGYNGGHVAAGSEYSSWANETQRYFRWSTTIYADAQAGVGESPAVAEWMAAGGVSLCNQAVTRLGIR